MLRKKNRNNIYSDEVNSTLARASEVWNWTFRSGLLAPRQPRAPPAYQVLGVRRATRLLKRSKPLNESPSAASDWVPVGQVRLFQLRCSSPLVRHMCGLKPPSLYFFWCFLLAQWLCLLCSSTSSHCGGERLVKHGAALSAVGTEARY